MVRRWQVNESQRAIARATGLARETVKKYLAAAGGLGLSTTGPPPTEQELVELRRLGVVALSRSRAWRRRLGVGKTFVVQAPGAATVRAGKSVLFMRADELLREWARLAPTTPSRRSSAAT